MDSSKTKPLSYHSLKCILEKFDMQTRENIHNAIPNLRNLNSMLPYSLDSVSMAENALIVNGKEWNFTAVYEEIYENVEGRMYDYRAVPGKATLRFREGQSRVSVKVYDEDPYAMLKKVVTYYLRNGTRIRKLEIYDFPNGLKDVKLYVGKFILKRTDYANLRRAIPFIDITKPIRKVSLRHCKDTERMLKESLIFNSSIIIIQFSYPDPDIINDGLLNLRNSEIFIVHHDLPIEKLRGLVAHWKVIRKPIGSLFSLVILDYAFLLDVFDDLKLNIGAKSSKIGKLGNSFFAHSVTIPIDNSSELVVYAGPNTWNWYPYRWTLKIEVMPRGATISG